MAVKIRLQRKGRKKKPFYHIVIADARSKRDGRMIERIGSYNPLTVPATIQLDRERAFHWVMEGAQPTNTVKAILSYNGVFYRKHLMRGVKKGAMTEEQAMEKYNAWIAEKEAAIAKEVVKTAEKTKAYHKMIDGVAPAKKKSVITVEGGSTTADAPQTLLESIEKTEIDTATGEMVAATDAPVEEKKVEKKVEAAPVVEEKKEEVKVEAAPVVEEKKEEVKVEAAPVVEEKKEEVKVEAAPVVEEKKEEVKVEAAPVVEEKKEEVKSPFKQDDLTAIEGIGPKIAEKLTEDGIDTWDKLAKAEVEALKAILEKAGSRFTMHNPTTWPQQAQLCVDTKWDELKVLQDRLDGGIDKG